MRHLISVLVVSACGLAAMGCVTEERITVPGKREKLVRVVDDEPAKDPLEEKLVAAAQEHPESAQSWHDLGSYYERRYRFGDALAAYEAMQVRIEAEEARTGKFYTGGLLAIGRVQGRLGLYDQAVATLEGLLKRQPEGGGRPHRDFVEAHYLLGWIHYRTGRLDASEWHLMTYKSLAPGSTKADTLLIRILDARRRQATVQGSYAPREAAPREAAADKAAAEK